MSKRVDAADDRVGPDGPPAGEPLLDGPLPGLYTTDELGRRYRLPAAPVSPAPAGVDAPETHAPETQAPQTQAPETRSSGRAESPHRPSEGREIRRRPTPRRRVVGVPHRPPTVASPPPLDPRSSPAESLAPEPSAAGSPTAGSATAPGSTAPGSTAPGSTAPGSTVPRSTAEPATVDRRAAEVQAVEPVAIHGRLLPSGRPGAGRHAVPGRIRTQWEARYLRALVAADLLAALVAGGFAFGARFGNDVTPYNQSYLLFTAILPLIFIVSLALNRAYERRFLFVGTDEYQRVLRAGLAMTSMIAIMSYALVANFARGYVVLAFPLATAVSLAARFLLRQHLHMRRARGHCLRRVIVVGHELAVVAMARQLGRELYHGLEVVGCCLPPRHDGAVGMPVYGTFDDVAVAVEAARADTVIVLSCPELDGATLRRLAWRLERADIDLIVASSLVDVAGARTTLRPVDGLPMLHIEHPRLSGASRMVKAAFDRVAAALGLLALAPALALIALAIRRDSAGPILFRQVRVGKNGHDFMIFKFRTMVTDAEHRLAALRTQNEGDGVLFKMRDDPRITRVGRWLRRFSLDELPQLINVVRGEMSLVGPRPPLPDEVAAYPADMHRRLAVTPGLTGLWQVSGRSDLSWEETVRLDLRYVENWSFSLDLVILLRTLSAVCRSSGAY